MKSLINLALLKEQLKRFWAVSALILLSYFLCIILPMYQRNVEYGEQIILVELLSMGNIASIIVSVVAPLIMVIATFSYLFDSKSTTVIHSYPINKNQLFFTNVLAGSILFIVPLLIFCLILLIPTRFIPYDKALYMNYAPVEFFPNKIRNGDLINTFQVVSKFFFMTLLTFTFYYSIFLLSVSISGNVIMSIIVCVVLPFIPYALFFLRELIRHYYYFGFELDYSLIEFEKILVYTSPLFIVLLFNFYPYNSGEQFIPTRTNLIPYILLYIFIIAVLFSLSLLCNRTRKQEKASESMVFNVVKNILVFLISFSGMIFLGILFLNIFHSILFMYIGFFVGFIISYFIAQMIAERTLNIFLIKSKDLIKFGSVVIGLFLIVFVLTKADVTGYSSYSPKLSDVESANIIRTYNSYNPEKYLIKDENVIASIIDVQKEIVKNKNELRKFFLQNLQGKYISTKYGFVNGQFFAFKLKNGKIITRKYYLPETFRESSGLNKLFLLDEVILSKYDNFKYPEKISSITLDYMGKFQQPPVSINIENHEHIISILEEIKKDILIYESEQIRAGKENEIYNIDYPYFSNEREYLKYPEVEEVNFKESIKGTINIEISENETSSNGVALYNLENTKKWLIDNSYIKQ